MSHLLVEPVSLEVVFTTTLFPNLMFNLMFNFVFFITRMKIFHFRVLMDEVSDVFRDIEISENATFLDLHTAILGAFSFSGKEMASFYASDTDWDKGEEISLMDMMADLGGEPIKSMSETRLHDMISDEGSRLLYLYDFMRMWIFYVELITIVDSKSDQTKPRVVLVVGNAPAEDSKTEAGPMRIEPRDDSSYESNDYDAGGDDSSELYDDPPYSY